MSSDPMWNFPHFFFDGFPYLHMSFEDIYITLEKIRFYFNIKNTSMIKTTPVLLLSLVCRVRAASHTAECSGDPNGDEL